MTRGIAIIIKSTIFFLGLILTSCFVGGGANRRMTRVVRMQQRFVARRMNRLNRW